MSPSPRGIRIILARGAFGLISTACEPPILTVSSAIAGAHARPASIAAAPKEPIHPYPAISSFHVVDGSSAFFVYYPRKLNVGSGSLITGSTHRNWSASFRASVLFSWIWPAGSAWSLCRRLYGGSVVGAWGWWSLVC